MKLDALDHPKTLDFAARLGVTRPTAIGHLELFWHFVSKHAPQGNIGKFPDGSISRACDWQGDPEDFLKSLLKSGFLDVSEAHRYLVHDWPEHCPNWVRAQLQKLKKPFFTTEERTEERSYEPSYEGSPVPSTRARVSKPREGKGRQAKASVADGSPGAEIGDAITADPNLVIDQIRALYPPGQYRDSAWLKAAHFVARRLDEGIEAQELVDAAAQYGDQQRARGKVGSEYILSPAKFFEADDWRGPFPLPTSQADTRLTNNLAAAEEFMRRTEPAA